MYSIVLTSGKIINIKATEVEWCEKSRMIKLINNRQIVARINMDNVVGWIDVDYKVEKEDWETDEEIKLGINLGDEVVGDYGAKGVVVGIDNTYEDEVMLSLLMRDYQVPQLVKASRYKTKTGRHFPQIVEVLEQIEGETDGK